MTSSVTEAETNRAAVVRLMSILRGDAPIESGVDLISPDVIARVDGWCFHGINVWANWIHYIRTRGRMATPALVVDEIVVEPDGIVAARGHWTGERNGRAMTSRSCIARYRLVDGRIVEIWSTRRNYAFLCGGHLAYHWGFVVELLRASRWKSRAVQLDLTNGARAHTRSISAPAMASGLLAPAD